MQFQGIGGEGHDPQIHRVTNCMYDHSAARTSGGAAKAASADPAQAQQLQQGLEGFSLSAWLERYLSGGKNLLRGIWSGGGTSAGGAGDRAGQAQVLAQMWEDRGTDSAGARRQRADLAQSPQQAVTPPQAAQAAAAVPAPPVQEATQTAGAQEESLWQKARVRFEGIAGQLSGYLRGNAFSPQKKNSFRKKNPFRAMEQERPKEESRKAGRAKKDAVEIDSYRVEESYLMDSYDRKGGYSRLSAKK